MVAADAEFGYDRIIGLELFEDAIDVSRHTGVLWWDVTGQAASPPDK